MGFLWLIEVPSLWQFRARGFMISGWGGSSGFRVQGFRV